MRLVSCVSPCFDTRLLDQSQGDAPERSIPETTLLFSHSRAEVRSRLATLRLIRAKAREVEAAPQGTVVEIGGSAF